MLLLTFITLTAYYMQIKRKTLKIFSKFQLQQISIFIGNYTCLEMRYNIQWLKIISCLIIFTIFLLFNTVLVDYFCLKDHVDIKPAKNYSTAATAKSSCCHILATYSRPSEVAFTYKRWKIHVKILYIFLVFWGKN